MKYGKSWWNSYSYHLTKLLNRFLKLVLESSNTGDLDSAPAVCPPATGQRATGTNWSRGSSSWTQGRTSSLWGWRSPGTGCPGRLWSLLLWRYSRPVWTRSSAACCRWPCFGRGGGLDDPQSSLPTPTILWFCDLVFQQQELIRQGLE